VHGGHGCGLAANPSTQWEKMAPHGAWARRVRASKRRHEKMI
jgi:hypothetical protein